MKLFAKCLPEDFNMLDYKQSEFRQIESIVIENNETGEIREFAVTGIRCIDDRDRRKVEQTYDLVKWDPDLPMFAIDLGDELDRNELPVSVPQPAHRAGPISDRTFEIPESEKTWHGVGE